ncbi:outer membrane protein assembly factor BamD [Candidatus Nucleicultrix amoebiphila]|uniref:outer membrane protein assembly factor BamD n=1 Tax=Candidatus Nucleicultrix amoebiphila TaxID=1509244 RepID=UPI000A26846A|nr:outer membrane protein assembly factor BamD [Candidatus Nucleicultrix amoebiphila]
MLTFHFRFYKFYMALLIAGAVLIQGCSEKEEPYVERSVDDIYNTAMDYLEDKQFEKAAAEFGEVDRQHPYSPWAAKAQLMAAYAYYEKQKYDRALTEIETFIQLHPAHKDIAYAYYLQGLCYYEQISPIRRDQKITELALQAFEDVIKRFRNTKYAKDARLKIDLLHDSLAAKEMLVGRDYLSIRAYIAALGRFKTVVDKFQTTSHVPEALHRMVEVYLALGLNEEARKAGAVLGYNFPGSSWYADSYYLLEGKDYSPADSKKKQKSFFEWGEPALHYDTHQDPGKSKYIY